MEDTAERDQSLQAKVKQNVQEIGHSVETVVPVTAESPVDVSGGSLENILDVAESIGQEIVKPAIGGTTVETDDRQNFLRILRSRITKKAA